MPRPGKTVFIIIDIGPRPGLEIIRLHVEHSEIWQTSVSAALQPEMPIKFQSDSTTLSWLQAFCENKILIREKRPSRITWNENHLKNMKFLLENLWKLVSPMSPLTHWPLGDVLIWFFCFYDNTCSTGHISLGDVADWQSNSYQGYISSAFLWNCPQVKANLSLTNISWSQSLVLSWNNPLPELMFDPSPMVTHGSIWLQWVDRTIFNGISSKLGMSPSCHYTGVLSAKSKSLQFI